LSEIAPGTDNDRLRAMNPELPRIALKLATDAGKTTVMAMLIAWQTLHTTRNSTRFTDRFLIVARESRFATGCVFCCGPKQYLHPPRYVPLDLPDRLQRARIVITNPHAFKARETMQAPKLVKGILGGRDGPICERCEHRPLPDAPSTDGFATPTATRSRGCFRRYCRLLGAGWISACTSLRAATLPI
jgi:type III restriction enzyme